MCYKHQKLLQPHRQEVENNYTLSEMLDVTVRGSHYLNMKGKNSLEGSKRGLLGDRHFRWRARGLEGKETGRLFCNKKRIHSLAL